MPSLRITGLKPGVQTPVELSKLAAAFTFAFGAPSLRAEEKDHKHDHKHEKDEAGPNGGKVIHEVRVREKRPHTSLDVGVFRQPHRRRWPLASHARYRFYSGTSNVSEKEAGWSAERAKLEPVAIKNPSIQRTERVPALVRKSTGLRTLASRLGSRLYHPWCPCPWLLCPWLPCPRPLCPWLLCP